MTTPLETAKSDIYTSIANYGLETVSKAFDEIKKEEEKRQLQSQWNTYCYSYGLKAENYNSEFVSNNDVFVVIGIKPRNRKYPIIAERKNDGKLFKFPAESVKIALGQ